MLTAKQCQAKALEMDELALNCGSDEAVLLQASARVWRVLAVEALWQDETAILMLQDLQTDLRA
jgi:hypothetical protein